MTDTTSRDSGLHLRLRLRLRRGLSLRRRRLHLRVRMLAVTSGPAEHDPKSPGVLGVLLENHARFLGFLERRVGSRDEAEDILQEAFVRSIGRTDSLESAESATTWFYRVLRNAIIDHYRREGTRSRALEGLAADGEPEALTRMRSWKRWPVPASCPWWKRSNRSTAPRSVGWTWTA